MQFRLAACKSLAAGVALVTLMACGGAPKIVPEEFFVNAENQAKAMDEAVGKKLALRSLPGYTRGDAKYDAQVGYVEDKPAIVKLFAEGEKWWIYLDTANSKVLFLKEEARNAEGKGVLNRFAYSPDSLIMGVTGKDPYKPAGPSDIRLKSAELTALAMEAIKAVEADRSDLPAAANAARRENAQFFAFGSRPDWDMVINPSIKKVLVKWGGENKIFNYAVPSTGPLGETIYDFRNMDDKLTVTIMSKWCQGSDGKAYPYSVVAELNGKAVGGCGVLLQ
jgi:uncharacterized membrane protein